MQRSLSSAPHGLGGKWEVPSLAREQPNTVLSGISIHRSYFPWFVTKQVLALGSNSQRFLPWEGLRVSTQGRISRLSIMNLLVSPGRDKKKPEILGIIWRQQWTQTKPVAICFILYIDRILSLIILTELWLTEMLQNKLWHEQMRAPTHHLQVRAVTPTHPGVNVT